MHLSKIVPFGRIGQISILLAGLEIFKSFKGINIKPLLIPNWAVANDSDTKLGPVVVHVLKLISHSKAPV